MADLAAAEDGALMAETAESKIERDGAVEGRKPEQRTKWECSSS